jgi:hypothetical protein
MNSQFLEFIILTIIFSFLLGDTIFLTDGRQTKIMKLENYKYRAMGCAAFHPIDDNVVFIFGGKTNNNKNNIASAFKYQINDESHHDLRPLDEVQAKHSCMGYVTRTGRSVSKVE